MIPIWYHRFKYRIISLCYLPPPLAPPARGGEMFGEAPARGGEMFGEAPARGGEVFSEVFYDEGFGE